MILQAIFILPSSVLIYMFNEDEIDVLCKSVTLNSQTSKKNKNRKNYKKNYYKKCLRKLNIMKMNKRMIITYT
jgi:hypothetical protein